MHGSVYSQWQLCVYDKQSLDYIYIVSVGRWCEAGGGE